ncbi:uncharacterized protein LOC135485988 [Lineus longissimus]|uniref:uncharacterized protein LOC135485988 n=1 Tax=Lineus longissimus TaxID=88925 RepID=UPI00315C58CC
MEKRGAAYTFLGFACLTIVSGYFSGPYAELPKTVVKVAPGADAVIDCWGRRMNDNYYKLKWETMGEPYTFYGKEYIDEIVISENDEIKDNLGGSASVVEVPRVSGQSYLDHLFRLTIRQMTQEKAGEYFCYHTYPGSPRQKVTIIVESPVCLNGFYCKKGESSSCLQESQVCNGHSDCDEGKDEANCQGGVTAWKRCEFRPCDCHKASKTVTCHMNRYDNYNFPSDMETLEILEDDLASMPSGALKTYTNLETLRIHNQTKLTTINKDSFEGLSSLITLDIQSTSLSNIAEGTFDHLRYLRTLDLSYNKLGAVTQATFRGLRGLRTFNAIKAGITGLAADTFHTLRVLQELDISDNDIGTLNSQAFSKSRFLRKINLRNCKMTAISPDIFKGGLAGYLNTVDLSFNQMDIPLTVLDELKGLEYLTMRSNGVTFDISVFQDFTKLKKLDLKGNGLMTKKPKEDFNCLDGSCYTKCGKVDEDFNRPYSFMRTQDTINIFAFHFDLETIEKYFSLGHQEIHGLKKVNIYADTVYANQDVDKKVETFVYARNFIIKDGQILPTFLRSEKGKEYWGTDCNMNYVPNYSGGKRLILARFGAFSFFVENIRYKGRYCGVTEDDLITKMHIVNRYDWLQAVTQCAQMNADTEDNIRTISLPMLNNVIAYTSAPLAQTYKFDMVYELAYEIRDRLLTELSTGARLVPYLNNGAYTMILTEMYTYGKSYYDEYNNLMANKERMQAQSKSFDIILYQAENMVTTATSDYKTSDDMLAVSEIALEKLKYNFDNSKRDMETAKADFDEAVKEHIAQAAVKAVFGFIKAIVGIVTGAAEKDPAAVFEGIMDLMDAITDLMDLITSVMDLMRSCSEIVKAMRMEGSNQNMDIGVYLDDLELAADLRVQIVHWDNMVTMTNTEMDTDAVREIGGAADFRRAVQEVANWGKALTEELIRQAQLLAEAHGRKLKLDLAKDFENYMAVEYNDAKAKSETTEDLVWLLKGQQFQIKITLMDYLFQYCRAYFFYQFRECSATVKPRLDDSMFNLLNKISQAKLDEVVNLESLVGYPEPITETLWIEDAPGHKCEGSHDCPIDFMKRQQSITIDITRAMADFSTLERVRVSEIEVFLDGATNSQGRDIYVVLGTTGEFVDYYRKEEHRFVSAPMELVFKYEPKNEVMSRQAKVAETHNAFLSQTTPFTGWVISVPQKYNHGIDLSGLTGIYMRFRGSGISYVNRK